MNRIGMIVDISHVSDKTFWDVIAISKAPVIASHSSARALVDVSRNMTDEMLRRLQKCGVVNVAFQQLCGSEILLRRPSPSTSACWPPWTNTTKKRQAAGLPVTGDDPSGSISMARQKSIPRAH